MRRPALSFLATVLFASTMAAEEPPPPLTLGDVFSAIRTHHPALAASRAEAEAMRARVAQEKAWMDPKVGVEWRREDTLRFATYSEIEVTASQELPLSRRNKLRSEAAAAEAGVADAAIAVRERDLFNQARTAYLRIAAVDTKAAVNERLRALLRQTVTLTRQAYERGQRMQADLITTQAELARLDAEQADLAAMRVEDVSKLNALMLREPATAIAPLNLPEARPISITPAEALAHARLHNPELARAARRVKAAEAQLAIAEKNRAIDPEIMVRGRQMNRSGDVISSYDTGVAFSVPWFNDKRNKAQRAEARSMITAARAEVQMTESELAGMVAGVIQRINITATQIARYRNELLPLAQQQAATQHRAYESGQAPLLEVVMAQRALLETEMKLVEVRSEHAQATASYDFLTAQDVTQ
ncbi:MAG: TolC family protein [Nibricoccus sp.]